jgi:glycosyltransferase involved in cell wall biosynthesis
MLFVNARFLTQRITGVQRFAIEICKQLIKLNPAIQFVAPSNIIYKELANEFDVKIVGKHSGHIWEQYELPKYLKSIGSPVLLNLCNTAPLFYKSNLVTIHDLAVFDFPKAYSFLFRNFYQFLLPAIAKRALHVFTVSQFSQKRIEEVFSIQSTVIYNSVSDAFKPSVDTIKKKMILSVSSLDPKKNFRGLVRAFIKADLKEYQLVVIGSNNKAFQVQDIPINHPNVVFTGYVSDEELLVLYQEASMFVYPSLYEGFGIPPLEAMASGCPTLVSDIPSLREVCQDASIFFDPTNIELIAEKIVHLSSDQVLRNSLIEKGYLQVKKFSWEGSTEILLNDIKKITSS